MQLSILGAVRRVSFAAMNCSVAQALEVVGEWWTMLIVREAFFGTRRFDDFQRRLGIARNVLTVRLARLVDLGVLERQAYQDRPPRFEYRLTDKGRDLFPILVTLRQWGDRWAPSAEGPSVVMGHESCDRPTEALLACSVCHEPLEPRHVWIEPGPGARGADVLPPSARRRTGTAAAVQGAPAAGVHEKAPHAATPPPSAG